MYKDQLVELKSIFNELYKGPLVSITNSLIGVETKWFLENFKDYDVNNVLEKSNFKYELSTTYKEVKFITFATEEDLENRGLKA